MVVQIPMLVALIGDTQLHKSNQSGESMAARVFSATLLKIVRRPKSKEELNSGNASSIFCEADQW
jgi:hypothetical protein